MAVALLTLALLAAALGLILGVAARLLAVAGDPLVDEITALMPGTNCGQCGFPGCAGAAAALVDKRAGAACCPPGGKALAVALAARLGLSLADDGAGEAAPQLARVEESLCIGCCKCLKVCATDAVVGAAKQIHNVLGEACTGCGECIDACPTEAVRLVPVVAGLPHWVWPKPVDPLRAGRRPALAGGAA
jgi:electron transport complex protein RnfB